MHFSTANELLCLCSGEHITLSEAIIRREVDLFGAARADIIARMEHSLDIMEAAVKRALTEDLTSMGGLVGGEAKLLEQYERERVTACGSLTSRAMRYALGVMEVNASMGLIVAAPTAGSSGVIPGVVLGLGDHYDLPREARLGALFCAGAVGYIIMRNATVSGAEGGCQAECGAAAAMAAAAAVMLAGGDAGQVGHAVSIALMNCMGLVCDPVAGLVQIPCSYRNASQAVNAFLSADMALAGQDAVIPPDEAVEAMFRVGRQLPAELRETALGGVAVTPTALEIQRRLLEET